jgi:hypothetical protein
MILLIMLSEEMVMGNIDLNLQRTTMKISTRLVLRQSVCVCLLLLTISVLAGCKQSQSNSATTQSLDPSSDECQTKMKTALEKSTECQTKGGNSKDCGKDIEATMNAGAEDLKDEMKTKMEQYINCKSQGNSKEVCTQQTGMSEK